MAKVIDVITGFCGGCLRLEKLWERFELAIGPRANMPLRVGTCSRCSTSLPAGTREAAEAIAPHLIWQGWAGPVSVYALRSRPDLALIYLLPIYREFKGGWVTPFGCVFPMQLAEQTGFLEMLTEVLKIEGPDAALPDAAPAYDPLEHARQLLPGFALDAQNSLLESPFGHAIVEFSFPEGTTLDFVHGSVLVSGPSPESVKDLCDKAWAWAEAHFLDGVLCSTCSRGPTKAYTERVIASPGIAFRRRLRKCVYCKHRDGLVLSGIERQSISRSAEELDRAVATELRRRPREQPHPLTGFAWSSPSDEEL